MSCIGIADGAGAMWYHATEKLRMPGTDIAYGVPGHVADLVTGGQSPVIILCTYSALQEPTQAAMPGTDRAYALQIAGNRILALPPGSASLAAYDSATVSPAEPVYINYSLGRSMVPSQYSPTILLCDVPYLERSCSYAMCGTETGQVEGLKLVSAVQYGYRRCGYLHCPAESCWAMSDTDIGYGATRSHLIVPPAETHSGYHPTHCLRDALHLAQDVLLPVREQSASGEVESAGVSVGWYLSYVAHLPQLTVQPAANATVRTGTVPGINVAACPLAGSYGRGVSTRWLMLTSCIVFSENGPFACRQQPFGDFTGAD
eukprot:3586843-Rhodomonas_salina.3